MANHRRIPTRTNIHPRLAELEDSETSEFVFTRELVRPEETAQLTLASDSVTVASDSAEGDSDDDDIFEAGLLLGSRYEITEHVHTGGMGHLYKATDIRLHGEAAKTSVAIKVLRQRLVNRPDTRNLLELEAARARQLSHPNIINVYDFDEHDGQFFLVMEWLDGKSVHELLQKTQGKRLDPSFAWRVINGAAQALQHAHENGVIHADVNPGNVFICDTQDIKLLDFGVARERSDEDQDQEQSIWATPAYASPDVLDGRAPVLEDDVFSLACVAYRLLAGKKPFGDLTSIEARRRDAEPEPIPGLPLEEWQLLESALNFDRPARPGSVSGFLREATAVAAPAETPLSPAPAPTEIRATPAAALSVDVDAEPAAAGIPMNWQTGIAAGAGGVLVTGLLMWALWPAGEPAVATPPSTAEPQLAAEPVDAPEPALPVAIDLPLSGDDVDAVSLAADATPTDAAEDSADAPDAAVAEVQDPTNGAESSSAAEAAAVESAVNETVSAEPAAALVAAAAITEVSTEPAETAAAESSAATVQATPEPQPVAQAADPAPVEEVGIDTVAAEAIEEPAVAEDTVEEPAVAADDEPTGDALLAAGAVAAVAGAADDSSPVAPSKESEATTDAPVSTLAEEAADGAADPSALTADAGEAVDEAAVAATDDELSEEAIFALAAAETASPSPAEETPVSGTKVETPPEKTIPISQLGLERYVEPRYPRAARNREQGGYVDVRFFVYPNGTTGEVRTMQSSPPDVFDRSAQEAVSRWRFARRDDTVLAQIRLTFDPNQ